MAQNQNLVPNLKSKALLILAVVIIATIGLFERRTLFTLNDGTQISGKVLGEQSTESFVTLMRASGAELTIPRDRIAEEKWFNLEVDINLGLDLRGGTALRYRIDLDKFESGEKTEVLERTVETFKKRLDTMGVKELSINSFGEDEISIELPGVTMEESQAYEQVVQSLGSLRFLIVAQSTAPYLNLSEEEQRLKDHLQQLTEEKGRWTPRSVDLSQFDVDGAPGVRYQWFPYTEKAIAEEGRQDFPFVMLEVNDAYNFTGEDLEKTFTTIDSNGWPAMGFEVKGGRASDFGEFTGSHVDRQMAIVLDDEVSTAPNLNSRIDDSGIIQGGSQGFTPDELKTLRTVLASGSLRVTPELMSKATIGPTLGEASIQRGVMAGLLAGILVVLFVAFYYRIPGIISCITLLLGIYLMIGGLGFLSATLTLPGIAGILLTVGMAVDQNILINERIREEREKGKTLAQSIKNGFERAFVTIIDAQATTFLAAAILYRFGSGPIKGFAVTLMLGIVATMFAALVGSKTIFAWGLEKGWLKNVDMRRIIGESHINFTRYLRPALTMSALVLVGGMALFVVDYDKLKGIDFAGGFQCQVVLAAPKSQAEVESLVHQAYQRAQIVTMRDTSGTPSDDGSSNFMIKIRADESAPDAQASETNEGGDGAAVSVDAKREEYIDNIRGVLGEFMLPDAIGELNVTPNAENNRSTASFVLHLTGELEPSVIEGRLSDRATVNSVTPGDGESSPTDTFRVELGYGSVVTPEKVVAETAASLTDLPGGIRLADPVPESQFIGGKVGKELRNDAIKAIMLAILVILIYIRIRFHDFNWGLAACIAAAHDVVFCLGAVTLVHMLGIVTVELDLAMIGAFLTIIGYSLNDTIVIFDRVRENVPRINQPLEEVVNISINQTLARTLLTSLTTLIAVVVLFVLNYGQRNVLEGFAFVIMTGVVIGTYSTIFIASPLLVWLTKRSEAQKKAARAAVA